MVPCEAPAPGSPCTASCDHRATCMGSAGQPLTDLHFPQELWLRAACSKPHHFHPALVSPPLQANASGHCSIVSVHVHGAASPPPVSLGLQALVSPHAGTSAHAAPDQSCSTGQHVYQCMCTAVAAVQLSPAVTAWNAAVPFARFEPRGLAHCCAGNVELLPLRRNHTTTSGVALCTKGSVA